MVSALWCLSLRLPPTTGSPHPAAIKKDAEVLVRFAREELGAGRIALHGESIGGMVAAHVARHCQGVELLIADRTFASLAAVANRLMCPWAGRALHFFTGAWWGGGRWAGPTLDVCHSLSRVSNV